MQVVSEKQSLVEKQIHLLEDSLRRSSPLLAKLEEMQALLQTLVTESGRKHYKEIWKSFHALSLERMPNFWKQVGAVLGTLLHPALSHLITKTWLQYMMPQHGMEKEHEQLAISRELSDEEKKAVMYAGGFVVNKLKKKYEAKDSAAAAEYVDALSNLLQGGKFDDGDIEEFIKSWMAEIDRGRLTILSPSGYHLFEQAELLVYSHLEAIFGGKQCVKTDAVLSKVLKDEHLQFLWSMASIDIQKKEDTDALLNEIVSLWLKIRGHTATSQVLEMYKQQSKRNIKRTKGVRNILN